jgi:type I restriction-modification system DNA methylase subunit
MTIPQEISELIERFERNEEEYRSAGYNETPLRRDFIDPFFEALGWDVNNRKGYAEAYRHVVHEDAIKIGGQTKAPDYGFYVGETRKFFVEAKRPAINVKHDVGAAFQLRRYGWSAKLPLSILTNFDEFAVYDCRSLKPASTDKAATARLLYFGYREYAERWEEIVSIFSREAVLRGAFDKYAEKSKSRRGTAEVDDAFLQEIESWRKSLAGNIYLRNPHLSTRDLNFAVGVIIDRIIFLRICEDRGIEPDEQLKKLTTGRDIYPQLLTIFYNADQKYNSGLFHFDEERGRAESRDALTPTLAIDDKVFKEIFKNIYLPLSPYEFSVLPADILGQVYEQFLGKVIHLTGHRAEVRDKPEVRKAGGVYYTPSYIVDYIVRQTLGKLCEGKTPEQVDRLRILDPACGSGSFLISAYQYLLDWYLKAYTEKEAKKYLKRLGQGARGEWRLTTAEKRRILLQNIYGVDIDAQAVEVTKLSLLLKVLEGESERSLARQMTLLHERALPDLGSNIKCGNSLIGSDFYDDAEMSKLDNDEQDRINAFDWEREFSGIMQAGGFDAVIGNPPYVLLQDEMRDDAQTSYFREKYYVASFKVDTYHLFIEQGIRLTKKAGLYSMITPANFLTNNHLAQLRRMLLENSAIEQILVIDGGVFEGISVDNAILVVKAKSESSEKNFRIIHAVPENSKLIEIRGDDISISQALNDEYTLFTGTGDLEQSALWLRLIEKSQLLGSIADVNFGKQLRDRTKYTNDVIEVPSIQAIPQTHYPCYTGRNVLRYNLNWGNLACLNNVIAKSGGCWDESKQNAKNKILTRQIGRNPEFAIDTEGYQCLNTMFMINVHTLAYSPLFILGILNSKIIRAFWLNRFYDQRRTFPKIKGTYLKQLPIRPIDFSDPADKARHDRMVEMVGQMLEMHKQLAVALTAQERTMLQRRIDAADARIDALVYQLYDLTPEEIKIVEAAAS